MKRSLRTDEKNEIRNFWLIEAISDEVEAEKVSKPTQKKVSRNEVLFMMRYGFDYDYRHYFDPYGERPIADFGLELFSFSLANWRRQIGKIW